MVPSKETADPAKKQVAEGNWWASGTGGCSGSPGTPAYATHCILVYRSSTDLKREACTARDNHFFFWW